jgi:hypothetical protein
VSESKPNLAHFFQLVTGVHNFLLDPENLRNRKRLQLQDKCLPAILSGKWLRRERHPITVEFLHLTVLVEPLAGTKKHAHHHAAPLDACRHHFLVCSPLEAVHDRHLLAPFPDTTESVHAANALFHHRWIPSEVKEYDVSTVVMEIDPLLRLWSRNEH